MFLTLASVRNDCITTGTEKEGYYYPTAKEGG